MKKYVCNVCGWIYDPAVGIPEDGIAPGTEFEDLPDCFKNYVTAKASIDFQTRYFGDSPVSQDLQMAMSMAYQDIVQYDMDMQDVNMLNLTGVSEVLQRT